MEAIDMEDSSSVGGGDRAYHGIVACLCLILAGVCLIGAFIASRVHAAGWLIGLTALIGVGLIALGIRQACRVFAEESSLDRAVKRLIRNLLRREGPMSVSMISARLQMDPAKVQSALDELIDLDQVA